MGRLKKPALAEQEFRKALQLDPNVNGARVNLGVALYEQEKFDDALKEFESVLQISPQNPTALRHIQLIRERNTATTP